MAKINPYITFNGNCEEAFLFYKSVFGGEFVFMGRFSEMPGEYSVPEQDKNLVMHVSLPIGNGETILQGSDTSASTGGVATPGTNFSISIGADTQTETEDLFAKLSAGGKITMPLANTFWGSYFGTVTDRFGIQWMVSFDPNLAGDSSANS